MAIDVEVSRASVLLTAHCIGQLAQRIEVFGMEKSETVIERETLAHLHLRADVVKLDVVRKTHIPNQCLKKTALPNVKSRITLTKAFVVKNAAFSRLKSFARTRVCW